MNRKEKQITWKRLLSLGLAAALVTGTAAGCGGKKAQSGDSNGAYSLKIMAYDYFGNPMKGENGAEIMKTVEDYTNTKLELL